MYKCMFLDVFLTYKQIIYLNMIFQTVSIVDEKRACNCNKSWLEGIVPNGVEAHPRFETKT